MFCQACGKEPIKAGIGRHLHSGKWRHRGPETKRTVKPNLQKWNGFVVCTRCMRTMNKEAAVAK